MPRNRLPRSSKVVPVPRSAGVKHFIKELFFWRALTPKKRNATT